jgi:hypothetical protein
MNPASIQSVFAREFRIKKRTARILRGSRPDVTFKQHA